MVIDKVAQGKRNRKKGEYWESLVRRDLESQGFIVNRWSNNVTEGELHAARNIPFKRYATGFPDFMAYMERGAPRPGKGGYGNGFLIVFVECKYNGRLTKEEKEKIQYYLKNRICHKFLVAYKKDGSQEVNYKQILLGDIVI